MNCSALADIAYPLGAAPELLEDDHLRMPCGDCGRTAGVCHSCEIDISLAWLRVRQQQRRRRRTGRARQAV